MGREKRKMERFTLELPATIEIVVDGDSKGASGVINMTTRDVCAGGAYFETDAPLPEGTNIRVDLVLSLDALKSLTGKQALIKVQGKVLRTEAEGMAVKFEKGYEMTSTA